MHNLKYNMEKESSWPDHLAVPSLKLRINIDNAFHELVRQIKKWQPDQGKVGDDNQNSKSGCCVLL